MSQVLTTYWPEDEKDKPVIIDGRVLHDDESAVVPGTKRIQQKVGASTSARVACYIDLPFSLFSQSKSPKRQL